MVERASILHSQYIIDGIQQELTPAQILDSVTSSVNESDMSDFEPVVDETLDPAIGNSAFDRTATEEYLALALAAKRRGTPLPFADAFTRARIAASLIDAIWREGHFRIGDLSLDARWVWSDNGLGSMAAFYASVQAAGDYLDSLSLSLRSYSCTMGEGRQEVTFEPVLAADAAEGEVIEQPFRVEKAQLASFRSVPDTFVREPQSWIVYVPFETGEYRLGGSILAQELGLGGGAAPQVEDADYFTDCYEVVRELVEDGVAIAGRTVSDGGLLTTLKRMLPDDMGAVADLSDVMKASQESSVTRVLFAELPGAVIQIRDNDFDYVDAELLLQDVAYFPLGRLQTGGHGLEVKASAKSGIQKILEALISSQGAEGED